MREKWGYLQREREMKRGCREARESEEQREVIAIQSDKWPPGEWSLGHER